MSSSRKGGNSASIRIPASILEAAKIAIDDPVDIREEQGRIVVEPQRPTSYDLAELIEKITSDNLHEEIDLGEPVENKRAIVQPWS